MSLSPIIEKVQKLLALSKSANVNEAAVAAGIANRLIDQYRLSTADLECSSEMEEAFEEDDGYIYESGKITPWKARLVHVLVAHYGCAYFNHESYATGRKVTRYRLVGKRSDIAIAKYMFAWLTAECSRLADLEAKGQGRVFVGSYCMGFVRGVAAQLKASRADAQNEATSAAIVKIDSRAAAAKAALYKMHTNLVSKKSTSSAQINHQAYGMGHSKGNSIHLGSSLSGGTKLLGK